MFMREYLKQGQLFKLQNQEERNQRINSSTHVSIPQTNDEESSFHNQKKPSQFNAQQIYARNSGAVVMCGAMICCFCAILGGCIFYFFLWSHVEPYLPSIIGDNIPFFNKSEEYLNEANAKQYFSKHQLIAGQLHYARIPAQYWQNRIQMVKSMGFNALSVYVFWNYHELSKGIFDFQTDNKNLTLFLQLAQKQNMDVLLRPGPYICAEWDFGGLPARLLNVQGIKLRSSEALFLAETKIFFLELSLIIKKFVRNKNNPHGPILMIQVENQPSWITNQKQYIDSLKNMWNEILPDATLYFDDIAAGYVNQTIYWKKAILGINFEQFSFQKLTKYDMDNFMFAGQVYSGWFSNWGRLDWQQKLMDKYKEQFISQFEQLLSNGISFSMYLPHGGTNFGLTAGFNLTTSYDYDSPIDERGWPRQKFHLFRSLITEYTKKLPPLRPTKIQMMNFQFGKADAVSSIFDNLPMPIDQKNILNPFVFQSDQLSMYNQGMVLYQTQLKGPSKYSFVLIVHDIAFIYLDDVYIKNLVRAQKDIDLQKQKLEFKIQCKNQSCNLKILVEALGHVNFGNQLPLDRKGILRFQQTAQNSFFSISLRTWKHYKFDLREEPIWKDKKKCSVAPCLYQVNAEMENPRDTFLWFQGLKKGYAWVNGHNLGRYWDIGPYKRLYCPGVYLKKGNNKIIILDLQQKNANPQIKGYDDQF